MREGAQTGQAVGESVKVVALEQQSLQLVAGLVMLGEIYSGYLVACSRELVLCV